MLEAVELLAADRSPGDITIQAVADRAGLSVGLAYHYFDSKEDLLARALDRIASDLTSIDGSGGDDPVAVLEALWAGLEARPAFARLIAWYILTGRDVTSAMSGHPLIVRMVAMATDRGHPDPVAVAEVTATFALAGTFFGPAVHRAAGRDPTDRELHDTMIRMFAQESAREA